MHTFINLRQSYQDETNVISRSQKKKSQKSFAIAMAPFSAGYIG
jgi:hypothetical protein